MQERRKKRTALIRELHPRHGEVEPDALLDAAQRRVRRAPRLLVDEDPPVEVVPVIRREGRKFASALCTRKR